MRPFFVKLAVATALVHVPFGWALSALTDQWLFAAPFFGAALALALAVAFWFRLRLQLRDRPISRWRMWLVEEPYFVHWCACFIAPLLFGPWWIALPAAQAYGAAYASAVAIGFWGVVIRRRLVVVRTLALSIDGLEPAWDGYRIAQLSDLHVGSLCPPERAERWVRRVNALDVDLVALTGDYCTTGSAFHHRIARALSGLRARDGVVAVMGNHDYFDEGEPLMTLFREGGIRLLRNERMALRRSDAVLWLAGVDDRYTSRYDAERALAGHDRALPVVVLAHDPQSFPELAALGATLVLSGHTHWGQVAVPWAPMFNPARWWTLRHAGLYRDDRAQLYVSPGLGTTGPPLRFGTAPEITVITLRAS